MQERQRLLKRMSDEIVEEVNNGECGNYLFGTLEMYFKVKTI